MPVFQIKKLRKRARMTQAQAAERAGVTRNTWLDWENERRDMPLMTFLKFMATLPLSSSNIQDDQQLVELLESSRKLHDLGLQPDLDENLK